MRVTLQNIADELHVSKASVSLALRNNPRISVKLRKTVNETAKRLGYLPDPALSEIAAHRWRSDTVSQGTPVAILHSIREETPRRNSTPASKGSWGEMAMEEARKRGYQVEFLDVTHDMPLGALFRSVYYRGVRGVILNEIYHENFFRAFPWNKFTCVAVSVGFHCPPVDIVDSDHLGSLQFVWDKFVSLGYRRIAFVHFEEGCVHPAWLPVLALYKELAKIKRRPVLLHTIQPGREHELVEWMREHRADAVIGFTDSVYWWLRDGGFSIPEEAAFASLWSVVTTPQQTAGMASMHREMIIRAFDLLRLRMHTGVLGIPETAIFESLRQTWRGGLSLPQAKSM